MNFLISRILKPYAGDKFNMYKQNAPSAVPQNAAMPGGRRVIHVVTRNLVAPDTPRNLVAPDASNFKNDNYLFVNIYI